MPFTRSIYEALYEKLELQTVGIVIGLALVVGHALALMRREMTQSLLRALPRNYTFGVTLLAIDFLWAFIVWTEMDLGEFHTLERTVQGILIVGYFLVAHFVRDFLSVRAIGMFSILLAAPLLDAAFLQEPRTRLLVVLPAYLWAVGGMFIIGMPYLLRDGIDWVCAERSRWKVACLAGIAYGALLLVCAIAFF